jgi:XTP/dITP diphosphohydrolase
MRLLYGTGNPGKIESMRRALQGLGIEVVSPAEVGVPHPEVDETGRDPLENARIKARAYYQVARMPVFSCDSGLYIEGLDDSRQPGVHVRNVEGRYLNDEEMIRYYSGIAGQCGGRCVARYKNAICLILDNNTVYEHAGDDISGEKFIISSVPHPKRRPGFPLDSLSIHMSSGDYYMDRDTLRVTTTYEGFREFFKRVLATTELMSELARGEQTGREKGWMTAGEVRSDLENPPDHEQLVLHRNLLPVPCLEPPHEQHGTQD